MNFVKKTLLIIFLSLFYTGQVSSSKLPLDNLFWNIKDAKIIDELFIVASFEDGKETSFLIRSKASEEVFMITNKTGLIVEGSEYFFSKMNKKSILLKNASNKKIRISFIQRYNLNNHFGWLLKEKPGGHDFFKNLFNKKQIEIYNNFLKENKVTDTILAIAEK